MTHDELLARLNDPIAWMESESESERHYTPETYNELKRHLDVYLALRAVVELHKPVETNYIDIETCTGCEEAEYPCPTIQAIEKELK